MRKISLFLLLAFLSLALVPFMITSVFAERPIFVKIDGQLENFSKDPILENGTTLIPFRGIFGRLGYSVEWDTNGGIVTGTKGNHTIRLQAGSKVGAIDGLPRFLTAPPKIVDGTTYVPLRFVSEAAGWKVQWLSAERTVMIDSPVTSQSGSGAGQADSKAQAQTQLKEAPAFEFQGISLGDEERDVLQKLGKPARKDLSEYGFQWYIYNSDYAKYIQVGMKDGRVVAVYTNSLAWTSRDGIHIGSPRSDIVKVFGNSLDSIVYAGAGGKVELMFSDTNEIGRNLIDNRYYGFFFYDIEKNQTLTSIMLIDKDVESMFNPLNPPAGSELTASYEKEIFDLSNAIRTRMGKPAFRWDDQAATAARKHSRDMAVNHYFEHNDLQGNDPFVRMEKEGLAFSMAAENIAAGQRNAIFAHEAWMNSSGHRKNILSANERLGVGTAYDDKHRMFYTQDFYTP
ncbi:CAP-associated domain-containing protein [Ferviditalea candida]|uniref:CAP-associated domain-containing protein n=1 Tax=Ferviditalea candida TaxID=3108399 RepID=A0ABU5ZGL5_9BACL|nr:CAP-associated domain-containing protein [Paenibacillaceae bacterium T2]